MRALLEAPCRAWPSSPVNRPGALSEASRQATITAHRRLEVQVAKRRSGKGTGREAFSKFECYACHEVKGETFQAPKDKKNVGPELSAMGPLHEAEYFAEAILSPSAVIEKGKGYAGPDGSSKMPSFNDSMTVQEAIDLVAYLRSLKPATGAPAGHRGH